MKIHRFRSEEHNRKIGLANKGKKHPYKPRPNCCGSRNHMYGITSTNWKGDEASYKSIREWVNNKLGKPSCCTVCGGNQEGRFIWVHIDTTLSLRDLSAYSSVCMSCWAKMHRFGTHFPIRRGWVMPDETRDKIRRAHLGKKHPQAGPKISLAKKRLYREHPEKHPNRIMAQGQKKGKGFVSIPQRALLSTVQYIFPEAILNWPVVCKTSTRYIDVGVPSIYLGFEYDGAYWHRNIDDTLREGELKDAGWQIIHFSAEGRKAGKQTQELAIQWFKDNGYNIPIAGVPNV